MRAERCKEIDRPGGVLCVFEQSGRFFGRSGTHGFIQNGVHHLFIHIKGGIEQADRFADLGLMKDRFGQVCAESLIQRLEQAAFG